MGLKDIFRKEIFCKEGETHSCTANFCCASEME